MKIGEIGVVLDRLSRRDCRVPQMLEHRCFSCSRLHHYMVLNYHILVSISGELSIIGAGGWNWKS